jgi:hypothetical protein
MSEQKDLCLTCGKLHETALWGAKCNCEAPNVVHLQECSLCARPVGYIIDDDYCGPEKLVCSNCVETASSKRI